jgi:hypothetical protein
LLLVGLFGGLFGEEVPAVERPPAHVVGPQTPDVDNVEPAPQLLATAPEREHGTLDAALASIRLVELEVDRRARAVVLAHPVDRLRVANAAEIVLERFGIETTAVAVEVVGLRVRPDHFLRKGRRLGKEEPVPVDEAELHVDSMPHVPGRHDVEHD